MHNLTNPIIQRYLGLGKFQKHMVIKIQYKDFSKAEELKQKLIKETFKIDVEVELVKVREIPSDAKILDNMESNCMEG